MEPATNVKPFKTRSLNLNTIGPFTFQTFTTDPEMTNSVPDTTKRSGYLWCGSNQLTVDNSRQCSEARASTSDVNFDDDRTHLPPNNKHTGHRPVVKGYSGPSLAHQQNKSTCFNCLFRRFFRRQ